MPQPSFQLDSLQIAPTQEVPTPRTISRGTDGDLLFKDLNALEGLTLKQLANLSTVTGVFVVGRAGTGAQYTSIQDAIDAVSNSSNETNPTVIVVLPGTYTENLTITKNGVVLYGIGLVRVLPSTSTATLTIEAGVSTTPVYAAFHNLRIVQSNNSKECVLVNGGVGSTVGNTGLYFHNCDLDSTGVSGYTIKAGTINSLKVVGGYWGRSATSSICQVVQCASFVIQDVGSVNSNLSLTYDDGDPVPNTVGCAYTVKDCTAIQDVSVSLTNTGSASFSQCSMDGLTLAGTQTSYLHDCSVGDVAINDTAGLSAWNSTYTSVAGTGTLTTNISTGEATFNGSATETVSFTVDRPNTNYAVLLEYDTVSVSAGYPAVTSKAVGGFDISLPAVYTGVVRYVVFDTSFIPNV